MCDDTKSCLLQNLSLSNSSCVLQISFVKAKPEIVFNSFSSNKLCK